MNSLRKYEMTPEQRKSMNREINKQIAENEKQFSKDYDATSLWAMHLAFGVGKTRMLRYLRIWKKEHEKLLNYYKMKTEDSGWLCTRNLSEIGIEIDELYEELKKEEPNDTSG